MSGVMQLTLSMISLVGIAALFSGCEFLVGEAPVDCNVRTASQSDPGWACRKASQWRNRCIPPTHFDTWSCLELDVNASFCPAPQGQSPAKYNVTVLLRHNNVSLDCNGQFIDHDHPVDTSVGAGDASAIRAVSDRSISNVQIKNCQIKNVSGYGVDLKRYFRGEDLTGPMIGHSQISVSNSSIESVGQSGIYVGQNSTGISITKTKIKDTYLGIYLEAGTSQSLISEVEISASRVREAIAVDSSHHNVIEKSRFYDNHGAILLYKNCGETTGSVCPISRVSGASDNIIRENTFEGDRVEVAARQWKLYSFGWCSDIHGSTGRWRDRSSNNVIEGNTFVDSALFLQDEPVFVRNNVFDNSDISAGVRTPPTHSPLRMSGEFTYNVLKNNTDLIKVWRNEYVNAMTIQNNMTESGACASFNRCPDLAALKSRQKKSAAKLRMPAKH